MFSELDSFWVFLLLCTVIYQVAAVVHNLKNNVFYFDGDTKWEVLLITIALGQISNLEVSEFILIAYWIFGLLLLICVYFYYRKCKPRGHEFIQKTAKDIREVLLVGVLFILVLQLLHYF